MNKLILLSLMLLPFQTQAKSSGKDPAKFLIFGQHNSIEPETANTYLEGQGVDKFTGILSYGAEVDYPIASKLDLGFRVRIAYQRENQTETPAITTEPDKASLRQNVGYLVTRINAIESKAVRLDAVAGVGWALTQLKTKISGVDGSYERGWGGTDGSLVTFYGASIGFGWGGIYLVGEAGLENNKPGNLKRTGNASTTIESLDLSGAYINVGLLFNGKPSFIK